MELLTIIRLAMPHWLGDLILMVTKCTIGKIFSSVRHSRGEKGLSRPCLPVNKFLVLIL